MPRVSKEIFVPCPPDLLFMAIERLLRESGFTVERSQRSERHISSYRMRSSGKCSCIFVVWVTSRGYVSRVNFGVHPRFLFFSLCGHGTPRRKLAELEQIVEDAAHACTAFERPPLTAEPPVAAACEHAVMKTHGDGVSPAASYP
jgi:hypothetical protein